MFGLLNPPIRGKCATSLDRKDSRIVVRPSKKKSLFPKNRMGKMKVAREAGKSFFCQLFILDNNQLSAIEASDIMIYTGETSDIRRGVAESNIILARLYKS